MDEVPLPEAKPAMTTGANPSTGSKSNARRRR
jgi:hypothetical protein